MIESVFERTIAGLIPETETALIAVSGGIDSMCLASLFLQSPRAKNFAVAHCNFHLRGAESDSDEELVAEWCAANGVRFHKTDFDTEKYAVSRGISIEMAARELRYDWFSRLCSEDVYYAVAVAHNANDNAETLILNLLRGTGLRGLTGMRPESLVPVTCNGVAGVRLVRPLLAVTRAQLEEYASKNGVKYHNDHTNAETVYKRNRIRHNVFPVFESINPSFLKTFGREMISFSREEAIADDYFCSVKGKVVRSVRTPDELLCVNIRELTAEKHWEYVLYRLLEPYGFKGRLLEPVVKLLKDESGTLSGKVFEAPGYKLMTEGAFLVVRECGSARTESGYSALKMKRNRLKGISSIVENEGCIVVEGDSSYRFSNRTVNVSTSDVCGDVRSLAKSLSKENTVVADAAALTYPFLLRPWMDGDWMRPLGLKGRKKVSDIFTDLKISITDKSNATVVVFPYDGSTGDEEEGAHVAAVFGYSAGRFYCRIDDAVKVSESTSRIVKLHLEQQ